jgi:hypothetical protein
LTAQSDGLVIKTVGQGVVCAQAALPNTSQLATAVHSAWLTMPDGHGVIGAQLLSLMLNVHPSSGLHWSKEPKDEQ